MQVVFLNLARILTQTVKSANVDALSFLKIELKYLQILSGKPVNFQFLLIMFLNVNKIIKSHCNYKPTSQQPFQANFFVTINLQNSQRRT